MRRLSLTLTLAASFTTAHATDAATSVSRAQRQVIAYLPDLQAAPLALALKKAAANGVRVYVIAPRKAHLIRGSFLPSVALAGAERPPLPLSYHFRTLNSPAFVLVDNRHGYLGQGLTSGGPDVRALPVNDVARLVPFSTDVIRSAPAQPARVLLKERYGLPY